MHERVRKGARVAEVGCGGGQALVPTAEAFPASHFTGYDVDETSIGRARERAARAGLAERVHFEQTPAEAIPHADHYDLVLAFNCIHDMVDPRGALAGIHRALRPHGIFLWSEANVSDRLEDNIGPQGKVLYGTSTMHCMTVSLAHDGEGLGNVVGFETARGLARGGGLHPLRAARRRERRPPALRGEEELAPAQRCLAKKASMRCQESSAASSS